MDYCQRCFRLIHYDKNTAVDIEAMTSLDYLKDLECGFIWLIDVSDLETSLSSAFREFYHDRECLVVLTKCDVLPATLTAKKLRNYVSSRLKQADISFSAVVVRTEESSRQIICDYIKNQKGKVAVTGMANAGKSTFINWLTETNTLTVNPHPSTTLGLNEIETPFGILIDSVGLVSDASMQKYLSDRDLKTAVVRKLLKPKVYQLTGDQSLSIGGLVRLDVIGCDNATAVVYCSDFLKCHRTATQNADRLWESHLGEELRPAINNSFAEMNATVFRYQPGKKDYCICGLGWVSVSGKYSEVRVHCDPRIKIISRKAMI